MLVKYYIKSLGEQSIEIPLAFIRKNELFGNTLKGASNFYLQPRTELGAAL